MAIPEQYKTKKVDVKKIFEAKNPKLLKFIPVFVIRFIKWLIHQDDINGFIENNNDKIGVEWANSGIDYLNMNYKIIGEENIPKEGRYIFSSNHPLGGPDGIMLISAVGKYYNQLKFPVNDILMNLKNLTTIFTPINKHGKQQRENLRILEDSYSSDDQILIFPAGLVSRKGKHGIKDLVWKKSFIEKAIKHKRDVIPVFISGRNTKTFYNIANLRKFFGIKANLEMMLLPKETFNRKNGNFTITFGKPIPYTFFDKSKTTAEWAAYVKEIVYNL